MCGDSSVLQPIHVRVASRAYLRCLAVFAENVSFPLDAVEDEGPGQLDDTVMLTRSSWALGPSGQLIRLTRPRGRGRDGHRLVSSPRIRTLIKANAPLSRSYSRGLAVCGPLSSMVILQLRGMDHNKVCTTRP